MTLRCDKCGKLATGDLADVAKVGGTHYRIVEHGAGIPGHKANRQARKCGTWVEAAP